MATMTKIPLRHPEVAGRRIQVPDDERIIKLQINKGLCTVDRGVTYALPIDHVTRKNDWQGRDLWRHDKVHGTHRAGTIFKPTSFNFQRKALAWLRDNVNVNIPYWYYLLTLGHDLHVSMWADLYAKHWHHGWADPITGQVEGPIDPTFESLFTTHFVDHECDLPQCPRDAGITLEMLQGMGGFVENLGLLSSAKVTDAYVNVQVGALTDAAGTGEAAEYNDFNEHEVGTNAAAENNDHTALQTSSGIALVAGTQVDDGGDPPTMTTVATITADVTETWEEHGVFSTTTDTLMDRSTTGGQSVTASDQVQYTYTLTVNPEA